MDRSNIESSDLAILARVFVPDVPSLSPVVARALLTLKFDAADLFQMGELAAKARAGTLTSDEESLSGAYERVGSFLALLKSKARRSLQQHSQF